MRRGQECRERSADHDEVEMGDDEVAIMPMHIEGLRRDGDTGHSAEHEEKKKPQEIKHGRGKCYGSSAQRGDPGKDFDGGKDGHEHGQTAKNACIEFAHARDEHVVAPGEKTNERNAERRIRNGPVTCGSFLTKRANDFADDRKGRQNHDVHGRMRIKPEKVLEQDGIPSVTRIENAEP